MNAKFELEQLYRHIQSCHDCPNMNHTKALRLTEAVNAQSDIFIISQSLSEKHLRYSGVNFFDIYGCLGNTGTNLEKLLNNFKRTIYPPQEIKINGYIIPKCKEGFYSIYNTEIAQCYPGKIINKDRAPSSSEIYTCVKNNYLLKEILLIKPKLIFLMGTSSYQGFFKYILKIKQTFNLTEYITQIEKTEIPKFSINEVNTYVMPIQHASGANPRFWSLLKNKTIIDKINSVLT